MNRIARLGACADVLDALPPVIAGPLGEWAAEEDPRLALWHACDAVEMALRLAVALGLGDWQRTGGMPAELRAEVARRLEQPTLGRWRGMALALARRPAPATPLGDLWRWVAEVMEPLAVGQGPAVSLAELRNRLAHGGGLSEGLAGELLAGWEPRLAAAFGALAPLADLRLDSSGDRAVAVRGGVTLPLWPLVVFAAPEGEGRAVWQVYVRRGDVRLVMTPLGAERAAIAESSDAAVAALLDAGLLGEPPAPRPAELEIAGFEAEWKRDAGQCIGRRDEVEVVRAALAGGPGMAWLWGPAGSGKTLVLARALRDAPEVLAFRFRAGDGRCSRDAFLRFLVERAGGEPPKGKPLREQARELLAASTKTVVADGVDEIAAIDPGFVADVLAPLARVTRVLAAGRPEAAVVAAMRAAGATDVFLGGLPPMAAADVRAMLIEKIGPLSKKLVALDRDKAGGDVVNPFVDAVVERAAGLPVYVAYVIGDLLAGRLRDLDAAALPPSLGAYHAAVLRRGGAGAAQQLATPLVATLALAAEPLDAATLHALMVHRLLATDDDLGRGALADALAQLAGLVRRDDAGFALFHPTLRDHVLAAPDQAMAVATARLAFARAARELAHPYFDDHGVFHLVDAGDLAAAAAALAWPRVLARLERSPAALPGVLSDLARVAACGVLHRTLQFVRGAAHHLERGGVGALVQAALADGDDSPITADAEREVVTRGRVVIRRRDRPARAVHGARQRTMLGHRAPVYGLVAAGDVLVSAAGDGVLRVWDLDDGSYLRALAPGIGALAATTRVAPAATADLGGPMPATGVHAVCAAAGAIVASHGDGMVRRWDPETGACLAEQRVGCFVWSVCATGERVAIAGNDAVLRVLDARTLEVIASAEKLPAASSGEGAAYLGRVAAVGGVLVVSGASRGLTIVDAATLAPVGELRGHDAAPRGLAAVGASQLLSVARDGSVAFWDVAARRLIARTDVPGGAYAVAAGNGVALVGTKSGALCRLRLPDLALERTAPVHAGAVGAVVALPDGRAATGGDDRAVRLVDPEVAGTARPSHAGPITALSNPGGNVVVTGGADGTVKIWDTQRGRSLRTIPSHPGGVAAVAAVQRPDGVAVFAASGGAVLEHRLGASGVVASQPLPPAPASIRALSATSPDELVAACRDGTERTWTRAGGWQAPVARPDDAPSAPPTAASADRTAEVTRDDCVVVATPDGTVVGRWTCDAAPQVITFLADRTLVVGDAAGELTILDVP